MVRRLKFALQAHPEELVQNLGGQEVQDSVMAIPANMEMGKEMPFLIIQGMTKNIGRDGSTHQKVPSEWSAIFLWSSLGVL